MRSLMLACALVSLALGTMIAYDEWAAWSFIEKLGTTLILSFLTWVGIVTLRN